MIRKSIILTAAIVLAACQAPPAANAPPRLPSPQPIAAGPDASAIKLARVIVNLKQGDRIGEVRGGTGCSRSVPYILAGKLSVLNDEDIVRTFNAELKKANYPIVGDPDAIFETSDEAEFSIAARVMGLTLNYCFANKDEASGDNAVTIEWHLFDRLRRRVVYTVTTTGTSRIDTPTSTAERMLFYDALSDATRALLADAKFHAIVAGAGAPGSRPAMEAVFRLYPRPSFGGAIARNMAEIHAGTVTVVVPGGHGSGFFVSSDGYLLTNAHVVGDFKFVRVRLASGREIAGEAIVVNRTRDVALVKVAESAFTALPISTAEPQIGSDIYAIGTPIELSLAATVTKGIVSAYRVVPPEGRMIQGDVVIQGGNSGGPLVDGAGNVVGISTSSLRNATGIHFFIPILDALKGAGIELAEARAASPMRVLERPVAAALQPGRPKPIPVSEPEIAEKPAAPEPTQAEPQQVASLAPVGVPAKRDGSYRTKFTASTINGMSYVDIAIAIDGEVIRGTGRTRGGLQCRANGELAPDGTAWINIACSNAGSAYLSWQLAGRFGPEEEGTAFVGRLTYANLTGAPGEAVFRQ